MLIRHRLSLIQSLLALLTLLFCGRSDAQEQAAPLTLRAYFVGNSVTDTLHYEAFAELFAARKQTLLWGRHVIPGSPLFLLWKSASEQGSSGFTQPPFGASVQAMTNFVWDAVTLQPFDRHQTDKNDKGHDEGDLASALRYIDAQKVKNPNVQFYLYERWPRMSVKGKSITFDKNAYLNPNRPKDRLPEGIDDWQDLWQRAYTGGWDGTNETKAYFEQLTGDVRKATPDLRKRVLMIPVGQVMAALDRQMKTGKIPGYQTIWEVYNDGIHLDANGAYLVACTFYATLTKTSPVGLPFAPYHLHDARLARQIQEVVWDVVRSEPLSGVAAAHTGPKKRYLTGPD